MLHAYIFHKRLRSACKHPYNYHVWVGEYQTILGFQKCIEPGQATVLVKIKLTKFAVELRLRCGSCKLIFVIISSFFAKFKNVVHSLEPGETPSYSASHQTLNYVQLS